MTDTPADLATVAPTVDRGDYAPAAPAFGDISAYVRKLSRRMWSTRGARLNAYRRLNRANEWSLRAITFLSVYAISATLSLTVPAFGLSAAEKDVAGMVLTAFSILILVLSLLEAPRNYLLRADRLHRCALELGELIERLDLDQEARRGTHGFVSKVEQYNAEYAAILARCPENHEPLDHREFRAQYPHDFNVSAFEAWRIRIKAWVAPVFFYWVLIYGPPGALVAALHGRR